MKKLTLKDVNVKEDKCLNCNNKVYSVDEVCSKCGTKLIREDDIDVLNTYDKKANIKEKEGKKESAVGEYMCSNCGALLSGNDKFCRKCGLKLENDEEENSQKIYKCSNCGAIIYEDDDFCPQYGLKFK